MRLIPALLLTALAAAAQQTAHVEGRVVTPEGRPVSKALVRIEGSGQRAQSYAELTTSSGTFSVQDIAPGTYQVTAQLTGYVAPNTGNLPAAQRPGYFTITAGQSRTGVEITLIPLGIVSGVVLDAEGDPVPGSRVRLLRYRFNNGQLSLSGAADDTADDRGQFRIVNVPQGRYYLQAFGDSRPTANGRDVRGLSALEGNLPTYYPSSGDLQGAAALQVGSTPVENLQVRMQRGRTYSIRGAIERPGTRNPSLTLVRRGVVGAMPNTTGTSIDNRGQFLISNALPGEYILFATLNSMYARAEITVGNANVENVNLRMAETLDVVGKMRVDSGDNWATFVRPAGNNTGNDTKGKSKAQVRTPRLTLLSADERSQSIDGTDATAQDGSFQVRSTPPGRYRINISNLPAGTFIKSVRFGGQDFTGKVIDITRGGELEVMLSSKAGGINLTWPPKSEERRAVDPPFVAIAWPVQLDYGRPSHGVVNLSLNPEGRNRFQALAPGEYYVVVWQEAPTADIVRIPAFLERFTGQATRVAVKEGEEPTIEPAVISREAAMKVFEAFP
jgi:hypothetical protein